MKQNKFITLEGIDGAGKSTQLALIVGFLQSKGCNVVETREPGGTQLGEKLRGLLLGRDISMHPETEALLMFAARREHLDQVILPALTRGDWVVSDRFTDASFAYQGGGRRVDMAKLEVLEHWTVGSLQPDLTLYFDVPVEVGLKRIADNKSPDRFEQEQLNFFQLVRDTYRLRAEKYPDRIYQIDASQSAQAIWNIVRQVLDCFYTKCHNEE